MVMTMMTMMTMMTTTTHIVFLSLGNLDEHGHQLVEFVKGDDLGGGGHFLLTFTQPPCFRPGRRD